MRANARSSVTWQVGGREVVVSNLDKLFWPEQSITKGNLLEFYRDVAPALLPYLNDRPFIMRLWPDGISGKNFYRWRLPAHAPAWLERFVYQLQTAQRTAEMPVVDDPAELIWVVNQGVIEMHPWVATREQPEQPTWMFFDLDPVVSVPFERVLEVAGWIGEMLDALGVLGLPKTSGGDGVHIFVPLAPASSFEDVRAWLGRFIAQLEQRHPGAVTSDKRLAAREGKVLIDYSQNAMGKSIVAPYSVRAKPGAPVSTPLRWDAEALDHVPGVRRELLDCPARMIGLGHQPAQLADHIRERGQLADLLATGRAHRRRYPACRLEDWAWRSPSCYGRSCASSPPSAIIGAPSTNAASSDASQTITLATSAGWPRRPIGWLRSQPRRLASQSAPC